MENRLRQIEEQSKPIARRNTMKSNEIVLNEINDMLSLHPEFS